MPFRSLILIFTIIFVLTLPLDAVSNPIPVPSITLREEHIGVVLVKTWGGVLVRVAGIYLFTNVGYDEVTMYFPVPTNVDRSSVKVAVNGMPVKWEIVKQAVVRPPGGKPQEITYDTLLGRYVFLRWVIRNPGRRFTVSVEYNHPASVEGGSFKALYAMATGRFYYSKTCTAYVNIYFRGFQNYNATIVLAGADVEQTGRTALSIMLCNNSETLQLVEKSRMFQGLDRDLLIILRKTGEPLEKWVTADPAKVRLNANLKSYNGSLATFEISLTYPHAGFKEEVKTWKDGDTAHIDIKVLEWTGPAAQVVTTHNLLVNVEAEGTTKAVVALNGVEKAVIELKEISLGERAQSSQDHMLAASYYLLIVIAAAALLIVFLFLRIRR